MMCGKDRRIVDTVAALGSDTVGITDNGRGLVVGVVVLAGRVAAATTVAVSLLRGTVAGLGTLAENVLGVLNNEDDEGGLDEVDHGVCQEN